MWGEPDPDPGEGAPEPESSKESTEAKEQTDQQQLLLVQLKDVLKKEQSTVPQEKVEEYINTLTKAKAKKSRLKKDETGSIERSSGSVDSRKHEKLNLMKQQLEENKAKLAQRGMRQKDIEDMVTVLKAQLNDSSQQLINTTTVSLEKNVDYNKNTSPDELYNILLVKEKRIADLLEKVHKQEGNILDLQENLKEKDSVIDARTKAITLMTENLSKKGKDTLDTLDETKEQMRRMQENFILLESQMKDRQMILLNDLKTKNIEISDLQEQNESLIREIERFKSMDLSIKPESENHELVIKDLKSKLDASKAVVEENKLTIEESTNKINELTAKLESANGDNHQKEVEKLKKLLEESNKNMIKIKAQNKSKVKDLNKKLDGFKKMSDSNAMIIQLQNEITKLNEKIAELEEEKGNMQLKMVESIESIKGSSHSEDLKELEDKLDRNKEELEEKDKIINLLESDILSMKNEIATLNEKVSGFSQLKTDQVSSEMQSIQIEEQLELLQTANKELQSEIESLRKEKEELCLKIEEFSKEKAELASKLDNYVQENMELIDKLEKLSAEKVSSAESIEIVEGLTQQEKLELAAYQKSMDDPSKNQEEEQQGELNESVLQLTEETAELLKKIEMFTMERKEVMAKLDSLRDENTRLSLKINEIENNRDILAETYEQVQTEKDELVKENENLLNKLKEFENIDCSELDRLRNRYEEILEENEQHKKLIKEFDSKIHEKDNLESELVESKQKLHELESKLTQHIEEINNYQSIIEDNKTEFINSSGLINKLQAQLSERENEVRELNELLEDLNRVVSDLQQANAKLNDFESLEKQVDELKTNLEEIELAKTQELDQKNREIGELSREIQQLRNRDGVVSANIEEMKQKYLTLQAQLDNNNDSLHKQVQELTNKNKEQLEKMKKIAANLKKKTQAYQDLEQKYNEEKEKWETEANTKESNRFEQLTREIDSLKSELLSKSSILEQSEGKIKDLQNIISALETQNIELSEFTRRQEKVTEVSLKQELSTSLHEEFENSHGSKESIHEDKINELQLIIETHEAELQHYKERSQMLEEDLSILVEEKERLVIKCTKLEEKSVELAKIEEEKRLLEEEMDLKLQEYGNLVKRVDELGKENGDLAAKIKEQEDLIAKLKIKVKKAQEKLAQNKSLQSELENQEQLINDLRKQLAQSESAQKQIQQEYEESQRHNRIDYERIEIDYQSQLDSLSKSKNELTFECEKLQEEVKQSKERECELAQEINENNQKIAELSENLHQKTAECHDALQQIESLQNELENTKKSTNLFAVPEESISEKTTNLFAFPEDSTGDFFSTIDQPIMPIDLPYSNEKNTQTETHQEVNVTKEDLESKIKALEILLYNVDQEKEQVILECSEMLNELTRLVYEKINVSNLSGQIVSQEEIDSLSDSKRLQKIEFEPVQPDSGPQEVPVEEHIPPPSTAYLTYPELEQTRPVERTALYQVGENDDGWGWGPEEARLEEEHQYKTENNPQVLALRAEIESLKTERDRFEQETKQLQLKSSKLIKKCKELKTKNDQLSSKSIDLDETIQEELKTRVEQLESKLKELTSELDKEKQDKSNLLKKIEALNASSSKILENKEIQEAEIYRWKRMYEEVRDQLDHLDWGNDESKSPKRRIQPSEGGADDLEELKKLVHDLTVDNEELQALLNDQKQQRVQLERSKSVNNDERVRNLEEDVASKNGAVEELKKNVEVLQEQLQEAFKELEGKNSIIRDLEGALEELKLSVDNKEIDGEVEALREQLKQSFNELNAKNTTINTLEEALDRFKTALESKENDSKQEKFDRDLLQEQLKQSLNEIEAKNTSIDDLQRALEESKSKENDPQLQQLENLLSQKTAIAEQFQLSNDSLSTEISRLRDELDMAKILQADASKIIENLQKQLERESEINQSIQQITNFKANNIEELMQLFNDEKLRSKGLEEDLEEQKLINDQLRIENTNKLGGNEHLEGDLNKLKEELNEINRAIQQLTEFKANNVEELIRLFNDEKLRSKGLEEDLEEQKLINDQLRIENTNKLGGNEQLEGDLKKLKEELNEINRAIQQLTEFKANNVEELIRLFNDEKMRSKGLEDDLEEQKLINDQLRIENTNKLGGNEHSEDDMKWLKTELNEMNQAIQQLTDFKANDIREFMELFHSETTRFKASEDLLQNEIRSLKDELSSKQLELDDLEEKWSQRVDERGNAVAESWKYHLSIVESDFAALQAKLKGEIDELEEKCNALVNENNELRKNVDAEIKNEVDRISALQQQINDRQRAVNDLKQMLAGEQAEKAALAQRVSDLDGIQQVLADKEVELASLRTLAETTRQQFDEKRELVEEIVRILESNTSYPLSCETRDILDELQRQLMVNKRDADKLNADLSDLKAKLQQEAQANREKDEQINDWKQYAVILKDNETEMGKLNADLGDLNAKLQQEALASREKDEQIGNLRSQLQQYAVILKENETEIGKLNTQLQNYSIIIHENQSKLDENEKLLQQNEEFKQQLTNLTGNREEMSKLHADLLEKDFELSAVYREKEQQLQEYNTILKQHETEIEKLNAQLQNYNTFVQENQIKIDTLEQNLANNGHKMQELLNKLGDNNKEMELSQIREAHSMLQQSLSESQQQLFQLNQDLSAKTHQYDAISEQLSYSQQNGDLLQREIDQLHHALRQKDQDLENLRNTCYKELESHYEEAITGKDLEVQTLRAQMEEIQAQFSEAQAKLVEQTALMDEEEKQLNETRSIIAEQVLVIEELKQKLFEKSNDYDSLIAEMDISRKAITQQPTASTSVDSTDARRVEDDLSEPVNRAELDLALYMLHQRDVRCEELTMELTHLLEERDTLQLKLSNAIREREQLLRSMKTSPGDGGVEASGSMPDTPKTSKSSEIFLAASGIELASEPTEQMVVQQDLANKLSELKSVGYRRDKTFVDEQEQRRMQQISIMQQHIKEASRLPPEAAAKLVDASYTLSRDVQSPSKVLLNWLWGRSTPKSNDT